MRRSLLPLLTSLALMVGCSSSAPSADVALDGETSDDVDTADKNADGAACPKERDTLFDRGCHVTSEPYDDGYHTTFDGFGSTATGGASGKVVEVTSLADDGPGSLRQLLREASGPTTLRFPTGGTMKLTSGLIDVPSDITLDARGVDLTIEGYGLRLNKVENVVLLNLAFVDIDDPGGGDAIQIITSRRVAIWHCRFDNGGLTFVEDIPDEQISVVFGATDITIAYCRFSNHDKVLLFGNGDAPARVDEEIRVTLHHNWFENTGRRHPFLRHGKVDMYNNMIRGWHPYLAMSYGSRSQAAGELRIERNIYHQPSGAGGIATLSMESGHIALVDNHFEPDTILRYPAQPEGVFQRPYGARLDNLTDRFIAHLDRVAGNTMPKAP